MTDTDRETNIEREDNSKPTEDTRLSLLALTEKAEAPAQQNKAEKAVANGNKEKTLPELSIDEKITAPGRSQNRAERQAASLNPELGGAHQERHGRPTIHAPELAGVRHNTTHFNSTDGIVSFGFENGSVISQHTQGEMAGAQVLQDGDGRVIRMQEPSSASGPNRPAREFEFQYPPGEAGQNRSPSAVLIRNAQTGELMNTIRADQNTSIGAHPGGFTVMSNGERKGQQVETVTNYNLSGAETSSSTYNGPNGRWTSSSMTQVVRENTVTADGIEVPRGSTMSTHWAGDGSTYTNVNRPNGQSDNYASAGANQPRMWSSSTYTNPTNLEFNINGQNQNFPGIRSAERDKMNGTLHLHSDAGSWTLTPGQNGAITNVEFKPNKPGKSS